MRALAGLVALVACTAAPAPVAPRELDAPDAIPPERTRYYTLWLGGARVGTATESETWSAGGVTLRRDEDVRFARGETDVALHTAIAITADRALVPTRVAWTETSAGGGTPRHAEARRDAAGWHRDAGGPIPPDAVPAELVPLYVRRDGRFAGAVFLPARGFASGAGRVDAVAPGRVIARLALGSASAEATIDLDADGMPARVVDGEGVIALRASAAGAAAPFPAVDLIAATAIPITGAARHGGRLLLDGDLALPALPGQRASPARAGEPGLELALGSTFPGALPPGPRGRDRSAEIAELVATVRARIAPDLSATTSTAGDALGATSGDCTTYALVYAALASAAAIPTQLVTGLRVDGPRLVRHRWAVSWTGRAWIAVDAAFDAAPAGGDLVGLALHDADDAGLVAGESALAHVRSAAWR